MLAKIKLAFDDGLTVRKSDSKNLVNIFTVPKSSNHPVKSAVPSFTEASGSKRKHKKNKNDYPENPHEKVEEASPATPQQLLTILHTEPSKSNRQSKKERKKVEWEVKCRARDAEARAAAEKEGRVEEFNMELQRRETERVQRMTEIITHPSIRKGKKREGRGSIDIKQPEAVAKAVRADAEINFILNKKKRQLEREIPGNNQMPNAKKKQRQGDAISFPLLSGVLINTSPFDSQKSTLNSVSSPMLERQPNIPHKAQLKAQAQNLQKQRESLPIWEHQNDLRAALRGMNVLVMLGETGSGKSTQIGQFLINESWMKRQKIKDAKGKEVWVGGCIAITQPRRVAAVNLARRVAQEMGVHLGEEVGYTVRFDNRSDKGKTKIKFLTDGMLLQEMLHDPLLRQYSGIIIDEAHERTIGTDLVMGFLKRLVYGARGESSGASMKLVVMSATIEVGKMAQFLEQERGLKGVYEDGSNPMRNGISPKNSQDTTTTSSSSDEFRSCQINDDQNRKLSKEVESEKVTGTVAKFQVPGRQFRVELYYSPEPVADYIDAALRTVFQIHYGEPMPGDILVFLTGQDEIEALQKLIEDYGQNMAKNIPKIHVLPLYAALSQAQQQKVFQPTPERSMRKIILATNIAETSVTVSGIRYVIDCGKVKTKQYRPRIGLESLLVMPVSKSSAMQRTGRAGRETAGKCFRLFTEEQFLALEENTVPEILRCDIASAILTLKARGEEDVLGFNYIDSPSRESLIKGLEQLYALGALDNMGKINDLGRRMAILPLSPALARVLIAAAEPEMNCLSEAIDIIAALSVESIFVTPQSEDKREEMNEARKDFERREGDHLILLQVVRTWEAQESHKKAWAEKHFVSHRALKNWIEIRKQLRQYCQGITSTPQQTSTTGGIVGPEHATRILKCFLKGFFHNTARLVLDGSYRTILGSQAIAIHPSSVLFGKRVEAIMYNEFVYTTRPFARFVSVVQMDWLMKASPSYLGSDVVV